MWIVQDARIYLSVIVKGAACEQGDQRLRSSLSHVEPLYSKPCGVSLLYDQSTNPVIPELPTLHAKALASKMRLYRRSQTDEVLVKRASGALKLSLQRHVLR